MLQGDPFVYYDNVDRLVNSAVLASALPTGIVRGRLGITRNVNVPNTAIYCDGLRDDSVIRFAGIDEPGDDQDGTYIRLRDPMWMREPVDPVKWTSADPTDCEVRVSEIVWAA